MYHVADPLEMALSSLVYASTQNDLETKSTIRAALKLGRKLRKKLPSRTKANLDSKKNKTKNQALEASTPNNSINISELVLPTSFQGPLGKHPCQ